MRHNLEIMLQHFHVETEPFRTIGKWENYQELFASKEDKNRLAVYASHATAKRTCSEFLVREECEITPHLQLVYGGDTYLIVNVSEHGEDFLKLTAVKVVNTHCVAKSNIEIEEDDDKTPYEFSYRLIEFPAVLAEKYRGYTQLEPMVSLEYSDILVTPKDIVLEEADCIQVGNPETVYVVQACYFHDEYKNEYGIVRQGDS